MRTATPLSVPCLLAACSAARGGMMGEMVVQ